MQALRQDQTAIILMDLNWRFLTLIDHALGKALTLLGLRVFLRFTGIYTSSTANLHVALR